LTAHRDIERIVLTRDELRFKASVDETWSELAYKGLVMSLCSLTLMHLLIIRRRGLREL